LKLGKISQILRPPRLRKLFQRVLTCPSSDFAITLVKYSLQWVATGVNIVLIAPELQMLLISDLIQACFTNSSGFSNVHSSGIFYSEQLQGSYL